MEQLMRLLSFMSLSHHLTFSPLLFILSVLSYTLSGRLSPCTLISSQSHGMRSYFRVILVFAENAGNHYVVSLLSEFFLQILLVLIYICKCANVPRSYYPLSHSQKPTAPKSVFGNEISNFVALTLTFFTSSFKIVH